MRRRGVVPVQQSFLLDLSRGRLKAGKGGSVFKVICSGKSMKLRVLGSFSDFPYAFMG